VVRKSLENHLDASYDPDVAASTGSTRRASAISALRCFRGDIFQLLVDEFADCSEILTVLDHGKPISAVLSFFFRDEVLPYYGGGRPLARQCGANDFMYWELMRRAARRGCRVFDFGRSKLGTGAYAFKKNWGSRPIPSPMSFAFARDENTRSHPTEPKISAVYRGVETPALAGRQSARTTIVRCLG